MRLIIVLFVALFATLPAHAQHVLVAIVKDKETKEPLAGATVHIMGTAIGNSANADGIVVLSGIASGRQILHVQAIGYKPQLDTLNFPLPATDTLAILLEADRKEMEEVVVSTTRSSRTIQDIPTRIELISGEELEEKGNMKPGDIRMLLAESTGIQTLQTSVTSANASIRMQGLDGRYTQILKDGFPLYAGFSGGLGLLQTPPLDLKQVEIIKGASSTLYGGGAIAGLINLISKTPAYNRELTFLINGTSAGGLDINGFYSQRFGKVGITMFAARNSNAPYDPANIGLTAIPKFERYTFNPKLFFYFNDKMDLMIGLNGSFENRMGGSIKYIEGHGDSLNSYFEDNQTQRISSQLEFKYKLNDGLLDVKNSFSYFNRTINMPNYIFDGTQNSTFTEINYSIKRKNLEWITGFNLFTDQFKEVQLTPVPLRNYTQNTIGAFVQNTWDVSKRLIIETGLREDIVVDYGPVFLPRISILYKWTDNFSSRAGGGLGYKTPTIFTEESERIQYKGVLPISPENNKLEKSYGLNWDFNYKTILADGKMTCSINQLFFYTRLNNPLLLQITPTGRYAFVNVAPHFDALGAETNIKFGYGHFKLFLGYTYTDVNIHGDNTLQANPLTPKHHTNSVLMYEIEDKWKLGLEAYYYSPQLLSDGTTGRDYWLCGFMAEKIWKHFSLYINFENFLDSRQTRFGSIYTGSIINPQFKDIYAPLDGFVWNGGIKIKI